MEQPTSTSEQVKSQLPTRSRVRGPYKQYVLTGGKMPRSTAHGQKRRQEQRKREYEQREAENNRSKSYHEGEAQLVSSLTESVELERLNASVVNREVYFKEERQKDRPDHD
ncbi:uncharacterized protein LOC113201884 [Frankliniella occidentalis]|uniref:Uncharacterized protein LOC113201884 n=1 Tax=Frankliniella occidentalis TaxID=133901 RepID=A0A6J1RTF1_FRAOC|nr:uncharacterized protein LOC113201884 [Frankliniella occidentalis]